ncbi:MAG: hypothetical protein NXI18_21900 [Alphaproteobacteria bacterium]|nr:hypothetical protein [Alphaproteobacteria bacterium]
MRRDRTALIRSAYALSTLLLLVSHARSAVFLTLPVVDVASAAAVAFTGAFLLGCVFGFSGVPDGRWWGFVGLYVATASATFGMGISMVPFVVRVFPAELRSVLLIAINFAFLVGLVAVQVEVRREASAAV